MKRVLIIGQNSYIGKSFEIYARDRFELKMVSSRNQAWHSVDFSGYDSILHCAGIAHVSHNPRMKKYYYEVNCDLAINVARKAKSENVKQFVFLSSILIYGNNKTAINNETIPNPNNFYGDSKLKAEHGLEKLSDNDFKLCILRPPMVYGKGCKGNFYKLVNLAKTVPFFPDYSNIRSIIYIDNLCNFICDSIDNNSQGTFFPQNNEHINTTELVCYIAKCYNRRVYTTKLFNPLIHILMKRISIFQKLFGNLYYSLNDNKSTMVDFKNSINRILE